MRIHFDIYMNVFSDQIINQGGYICIYPYANGWTCFAFTLKPKEESEKAV